MGPPKFAISQQTASSDSTGTQAPGSSTSTVGRPGGRGWRTARLALSSQSYWLLIPKKFAASWNPSTQAPGYFNLYRRKIRVAKHSYRFAREGELLSDGINLWFITPKILIDALSMKFLIHFSANVQKMTEFCRIVYDFCKIFEKFQQILKSINLWNPRMWNSEEYHKKRGGF